MMRTGTMKMGLPFWTVKLKVPSSKLKKLKELTALETYFKVQTSEIPLSNIGVLLNIITVLII